MPQYTQKDFWKLDSQDRKTLGELVAEHRKATKALDEALEKAVRNGATFTELAMVLGRTEGAIRLKARRRKWYTPGERQPH